MMQPLLAAIITLLGTSSVYAGCANYTDGSMHSPAPRAVLCFSGKCERTTLNYAVITQGLERGDRQWSGRDRAEHGSEGARAGLEAGCRHHGANRGLALGRPHGSVAVRVLALDHRRPQVALAGVVGGFDPAGEGRKRQHLVARPPHPGL